MISFSFLIATVTNGAFRAKRQRGFSLLVFLVTFDSFFHSVVVATFYIPLYPFKVFFLSVGDRLEI